jgi:hypothetical protein
VAYAEKRGFAMKVNVTVKRKLVFNGREYSSVDELPESVRAAYEKAVAGGLAPEAGAGAPGGAGRIVVNGQAYADLRALRVTASRDP